MYNCIDDQNKLFISILSKNDDLMCILDYISSLDLPNFYIAAGSVFQTIWNYYDGVIKIYAPYGLSDIFSRTIRPIKHEYNSKELYDKKVKSWSSRYDNLNIIEW